jgi:signal transduction histidine kinase
MKRNAFRALQEQFGLRVFAELLCFISILCLAFIALFVRYQGASLEDTLIEKGKLLSRVLAHNARIGVFSENNEILEGPMDRVLQQEGVLEAALYNLHGELLKRKMNAAGTSVDPEVGKDPAEPIHALESIRTSGSSICLEHDGRLEFWSAVVPGSIFLVEDSLLHEEGHRSDRNRVIGFASVTVDKEATLEKPLKALMMKGLLLAILFLLIGSAATYVIVKRFTRPINALTRGVKALGSGGDVGKILVRRHDEIGRLGRAFNQMSESLRVRKLALEESEAQLRSLSARLMEVQEQERQRLSKGLHDGLGHDLALMKFRLRSLGKKLDNGVPEVHQSLQEAVKHIDQIIDDVRRISMALSPSILEDLGLSAALRNQVETFSTQHSLALECDTEDIDAFFSPGAQINLYRFFQEALTNILNHSRADQVRVVVKKEKSSIRFCIEDNGKGFDTERTLSREPEKRGMGLTTMRERARMLNGTLEILSQPNLGTRIKLIVPIEMLMEV